MMLSVRSLCNPDAIASAIGTRDFALRSGLTDLAEASAHVAVLLAAAYAHIDDEPDYAAACARQATRISALLLSAVFPSLPARKD